MNANHRPTVASATPHAENRPVVELSDVTKTFPGVKALNRVSLKIYPGQVLALVGENGAGKSTLMKVLSGVYPAGSFEGKIILDGAEVKFRNPKDAEEAGIAIIHQELSSFKHLSVAENLFVGRWPKRSGLLNWPEIVSRTNELLKTIGADFNAFDQVADLSVGNQQLLEIAKALSRKSRVLILDEPTSALTPKEVHKLYSLLAELKAQGVGLVYISHKMEEIYHLADRITVLRDGESVHTAMTADLPEPLLIQHMVGRRLEALPNYSGPRNPDKPFGDIILRVENYQGYTRANRKPLFGPMNFEIRRGEIFGLGGLLGAGRTELIQSLFGDPRMFTKGRVFWNGKVFASGSPREGLRARIAFVSEDRKNSSILPGRSLNENIGLSRLSSDRLWKFLTPSRELKRAQDALVRFKTRTTGPEQEIRNLSGGNQQKAILARALEVLPDLIILDEPTRGIDIGAKYEIYEILASLAEQGKTLIIVSSELPELFHLSDRIMVLAQGKQMGILQRHEYSQERVMSLAVGRSEEPLITPPPSSSSNRSVENFA